jgi:hypothetical protein
MARPVTGGVDVRVLRDGTRAFHVRFSALGGRKVVVLHERVGCECGCGGGWDERAARRELGDALARVRAGVWTPRQPTSGPTNSGDRAPAAPPTFHAYASTWLQGKVDGVIGAKPIDANTEADYRWRLCRHLLPFFDTDRLDEIDRHRCLEFKAYKLREAQEMREALAAKADIRDERGRRAVPLGPSSIGKLIDTLAAILDDAVEGELIDRNPARGRRMRVWVPGLRERSSRWTSWRPFWTPPPIRTVPCSPRARRAAAKARRRRLPRSSRPGCGLPRSLPSSACHAPR